MHQVNKQKDRLLMKEDAGHLQDPLFSSNVYQQYLHLYAQCPLHHPNDQY